MLQPPPVPTLTPETIATATPIVDAVASAAACLTDPLVQLTLAISQIAQGITAVALIVGFIWGIVKLVGRRRMRDAPAASVTVAPKTTAVASHRIVAPPDDFAGCDIELAELRRQHEAGRRALGIFGMGGVGKTTLARRFAQELQAAYPDEQIEISLSGMQARPVTMKDALIQIITSLRSDLVTALPDSVDDLCGLMRDAMRGKRGILLLDDAAGPEQVGPLLARPLERDLSWLILVTAREAFSPGDLRGVPHSTLAPSDAEELLRSITPRVGNYAAEIAGYAGCGEHRRAIEYCEQALAIRREVGDRRGEGIDLRNLADAHLKVGQPERARELAEAGIAIAQGIAYELGEAIGRFHLGRALWALNQQTEGRAKVERALAVFERLGDEERVKEARERLAEWDDPPPAEPASA